MTISAAPVFTPTPKHPCPRMRGRGVYANDTLWNGQAIIVAVDSHSNVVHFEPWTDEKDLAQLISEMTEMLDRVDPVRPVLTVCRGDASS